MPSSVTGEVRQPLGYYSYSAEITPEAISEIPIKVDPLSDLKTEIDGYVRSVSSSIERIEGLYREALNKNFIVPTRFIEGNLRAAKDLKKIFEKELGKVYEGIEKGASLEELRSEVRVLRLLAERIEMLYLSSEEFYRRTTNFVPFRVRVLSE